MGGYEREGVGEIKCIEMNCLYIGGLNACIMCQDQ